MLRTSGKQDWRTPKWLFRHLDAEFGPFVIDVAADDSNHLCKRYYTIEDNALVQTWPGPWFCNPPFAKIAPWIEHAIEQGSKGVMILPTNSLTANWFWPLWRKTKFGLVICRPRVAFEGVEGKNQPNGGISIAVFGYQRKVASGSIQLVNLAAEKELYK